MTKKLRLTNWCVTVAEPFNAYLPPEAIVIQLKGNVYGHPKHEDGKYIRTSPIRGQGEKPNEVLTEHNTYVLEDVDPSYLKYCEEHGLHIPTPEQPLKWHNDERQT